jgi:uncharacterized protein YjiS (DUF1127 family)
MRPVTFLGLRTGRGPGWAPWMRGAWLRLAPLASAGWRDVNPDRSPKRGAGIPAFAWTLMRQAGRLPSEWRQRRRKRGQLRDLSDHILRDIGLRREQWRHNTSKPVWW